MTDSSSDKRSSVTPSLLIFKKNQYSERSQEGNSSVLVVEQDNHRFSYNIEDNNKFFNSREITGNIKKIKNELAHSSELERKVCKKLDGEPDSPIEVKFSNKALLIIDDDEVQNEEEKNNHNRSIKNFATEVRYGVTETYDLQTNPTKEAIFTEEDEAQEVLQGNKQYDKQTKFISEVELQPTTLGNTDLINNGKMKNKSHILEEMKTLETDQDFPVKVETNRGKTNEVNFNSSSLKAQIQNQGSRKLLVKVESNEKSKQSAYEDQRRLKKATIIVEEAKNHLDKEKSKKIYVSKRNTERSESNNVSKAPNRVLLLGENKQCQNKLQVSEINKPISKEDVSDVIDYEDLDIDELEYPFKMCFVCDNYRDSNQVFFGECCHFFCWKCGKKFYESKIDHKDYFFKCPLFKCTKVIPIQMIMKIISDKHYDLLVKKDMRIENNNDDDKLKLGSHVSKAGLSSEKNKETFAKKFILSTNENLDSDVGVEAVSGGGIITSENNLNIKFNQLRSNTGNANGGNELVDLRKFDKKNFGKKESEKSLNKHFIEIENFDVEFIHKYQKNKERYCFSCGEPALFEVRKHIIKCLNCNQIICKFCLKQYHSDHFDLTSFNYCKVFFRHKLSLIEVSENSKSKETCMNLLIFLLSYFVFWFGTFSIVYNWLNDKLDPFNKQKVQEKEIDVYSKEGKQIESPSKVKVVFFIILVIFLWIFSVFALFIVVPFFPILVTINR